MSTRQKPDSSFLIVAQRATVLSDVLLSQLLQVYVPGQHDFLFRLQISVYVERVEGHVGRVLELFRAEVEAALLEGHERGGGEETGPKINSYC